MFLPFMYIRDKIKILDMPFTRRTRNTDKYFPLNSGNSFSPDLVHEFSFNHFSNVSPTLKIPQRKVVKEMKSSIVYLDFKMVLHGEKFEKKKKNRQRQKGSL